MRARLARPANGVFAEARERFGAVPAFGEDPDPRGLVALHCPKGAAADLAGFLLANGAERVSVVALLAVVAPNLAVKPSTVMFNKVTIKGAKQAVQMFGPAQYGVAKAVADSVADGTIPAWEADDLFICVGVFIHWEAADDKKIQDFNYAATKEALERAVAGHPTPQEVVSKRDTAKHPFGAN